MSAKGLFQILDGTWKKNECEGDPLKEDDNINCASKIYKEKGIVPWMSSFDVWSKDIATSTRDKIKTLCSCMSGLASKGILIKGNAEDIVPNSIPGVGKVILFQYGHVALITKITNKGFKIWETNYSRCKETERLIPFDDPKIKGFYEKP